MTTQANATDSEGSGMSLERILSTGKRFTAQEAVPLLVEVCALVEKEHEAGKVVRSLAPAKIVVSAERVRLLEVTAEDVVQKPYGAPEVLAGREHDRRADLYSIGVIAHRMLSGSDANIGRLA